MLKVDFSTPKEKKKVIRSVIETIILLILFYFILRALVSFSHYEAFAKSTADNTNGFIAISYFGVDRNGDDKLISTKRLDEQLETLYNEGYKIITQSDIEAYYKNGTPLPKKALYLMFEDGRRDTAIFAQKILEKYNFKATIMSYVERFDDNQTKFLGLNDLKKLKESSYWELGTNGYRLSYINVFNKYNKYLGEMSSLEFNKISNTLGRNYNHYLMDYIRDEDNVPKESRSQMEKRISWDYKQIKKVYTDGLGYVPPTYVLMHSNTGEFGNNEKVSAVNEKWIKQLFTLNFNREGYCMNTKNSSVYDLTRMQPQSYWYTNHLLMRIKNDTKESVNFVKGDTKKLSDWATISGAAQYEDEKIIVTSEEDGKGLLRLKKSIDNNNIYFNSRLTGNKVGKQKVYVGADDSLSHYLSVGIEDNNLIVSEKESDKDKESEIANINLDKIDNVKSEDEIDIREAGNRKLNFQIKNGRLTIWIDDKEVIKDKGISNLEKGSIYLMSSYSDSGWSQRNLSDHVYDGVFENTFISTDKDEKQLLYNGCYTGIEKAEFKAKNICNAVVNWFIKYL